jgi:DNA-directed RNA polymerase subunit alpha
MLKNQEHTPLMQQYHDIKIDYPEYKTQELKRVAVDTESKAGKLREAKRLLKEQQKIEKEKQELDNLLAARQRIIEERKQRLQNVEPINIFIEDLDDKLSVRTRNCLRHEGIKTIGDLILYREWRLMTIRNFGIKCLHEINELLKIYNLKLFSNTIV